MNGMKRLALAVLLGGLTAACGGDDDGGASCEDFAACGGDPVGEWSLVDTCVEGGNPFGANCPDATFDYSGLTQTGSVSVNANNTYTATITTAGNIAAFVPTSCLQGASCTQLDQSSDDLSCTDADGGCDCTVSASDMSDDSGTWSVAGNSLTLTPDGEAPEAAEFCVKGDSFTVRPATDQGDPTVTIALSRK